ncbi:hypothetical protein [Moorena sp. SIO4A5]|uniref:hypothetical protein n=1 Tax=Moorena sp. SIO4A5 TaxID=2607838 RepID=UPI0013C716B4|nr:hypothetical protein [Moorena sp. SIO4A5]NEO22505.1 hypothetical protein [Moorena sp. SIO4A5]
MVTLRSGSVSAKPTLRERKAWPMASASALMRSHFPTPYSLLPTPYSLLPTPYSLLPTPYSLLPTPYSLLPYKKNSRRNTIHGQMNRYFLATKVYQDKL